MKAIVTQRRFLWGITPSFDYKVRLFARVSLQSISGLHSVGQSLTHTQTKFVPLQGGFKAKLFKAL